MPVNRRLVAAFAAATLGWSTLTLGAATPEAGADPGTHRVDPVDRVGPRHGHLAAPARRAPHDPSTYYAGTEGLSGADLASVLNDIIDGHTTFSYTPGVWNALEVLDEDPNNSAALIDFYAGTSNLKSNRCGSSCGTNGWNREHTWPQSHGNFGTGAGVGTDLHHMRPEYGSTNSSRGNKDFDNGGTANVPLCALCRSTTSTFEPRDAVKGDLARGLFYMAVRYDGEADDGSALNLKMNDYTCNESGPPNIGKLSTLVAWSLADPPDARERARNDLVDGSYQGNRNPFIDHPEWVTAIYGNGVGLGPACGSTSGSDTLPGGITAITNTTAPTISGTPAVGSQLTATSGTWSPSDGSYAYQWFANGVQISGATAATYTPSAAQVGKLVSVRVRTSRAGYSPVDAGSASVRVAAAPVTNTTQPLITGTATVGQTLSLSTGSWNYGDLTYSYQWYANGAAIRGAGQSTYVVPVSMAGKTIVGRVTASRPGSDAVVATSSNSVVPSG